jgi:hypothetical protein
MIRLAVAALTLTALQISAAPASAKDSLGVYSNWAAFRDARPTRCYAIAKPRGNNEAQPFASIGNWPGRNIRGQLHMRLSRTIRVDASVRLTIGNRQFVLAANGRNAWAKDQRMDAAIVASIRSAPRMTVSARDNAGRRFTDSYDLAGVATAIDAAIVGCARRS